MATDDPYGSPLHYDLEYGEYRDDLAWYVQLANRFGGPILELGCGNGRITLELARAGVNVHGIDANPRMLEDLASKLHAAPDEVRARVTSARADFRALEVDPEYALALLPFNTIHHCRTHRDVLAVFAGLRRALRPGGRFALDMYLPYPTLYERDPAERYGECVFTDPRTGEPIESWEQSWYDPLEQLHRVTYSYDHGGGRVHEVRLVLRMFYPQEIRALVDWAGFDVIAESGDFHGRPLGPRSTKWVAVLAPR